MLDSNEQMLDTGLAALEMTKTTGWQWLEQKIRNEINIELNELRNFELAELSVEQIAAEYLRHRTNLNAYENIISMVETAIEEKENAAHAMRS